ncbi:unnamed protein product [Rotaria sp. Silwood1]|nr:unnamed protein product [Rotaria sp. Silwood1]CAF3586791.1 unnamed protein product [Rotaria sp. Silwood1]CAF3609223.1 unnamed protein product [Rotaria sp. Silwood1]CAF3659466.1 unnamed protein product [Rotaria sp. Silwood1]CAF4575266.1 unnamed protein product [Rotaria sp. Silwood1]
MLVECRRIYKDNEQVLAEIDAFDQMYHSNAALQWYSRDSFLFQIINQALRSSNVNAMFKMRYFLTDLYAPLHELNKQKNHI